MLLAMSSGVNPTRYARLRQRWVDRAALRMFERLRAQPSSYRSAPSTIAATVIAVMVLAGGVAVLALLVWATLHASGPVWIVLVVLGWAAVIVARPTRFRLDADAHVLDRADYPGLHELVAAVGSAVGVRAPSVIAVNLDFNALVVAVGRIRHRDALVLGLPMMSLGTWHERVGVLGHELGHLRGRDTGRGRLFGAAATMLAGVHELVAPSAADLSTERSWYGGVRVTSPIAYAIQAVLVFPFIVLSLLLERFRAAERQHREYLADRRAAEIVGSESVASSLLWDLEGIAAATAAAARRGEDPFDVLRARPAMTSAQKSARLAGLEREVHRAGATHPPDHLRARLVSAQPLPPSALMPADAACLRAEEELDRLRRTRSAEFSVLLRHNLS
jgi:Zn-dependent protease with chaperone function